VRLEAEMFMPHLLLAGGNDEHAFLRD